MFGRKRPRVLIAGAGPAGLLGALCLAERGVQVQVVDSSTADEAVRRRKSRGAVTLLYPRSLELLERHGIAAPLLSEAQKVRTIGVYAQGDRIGELSFERFLSGYYAESLRIVQEAHLADCTVPDGQGCNTCAGIRVGLAGLAAEQRAVTSGEVTTHGR